MSAGPRVRMASAVRALLDGERVTTAWHAERQRVQASVLAARKTRLEAQAERAISAALAERGEGLTGA